MTVDRTTSFWGRRRRRALSYATSATIAVGLCMAGLVSSVPGNDAATSENSSTEAFAPADPNIEPAMINEDLLGLSLTVPQRKSAANEATTPSPAASQAPAAPKKATKSSEVSPEAFAQENLEDALWYDETTHEAQILVKFADEGVATEAIGDAAVAAASLQENSQAILDAAQPAISDLVESGAITVLNDFWLTTSILVEGIPTDDTLFSLADLPGATHIMPNYEVTALDIEEPIVEAPPINEPDDYVDRNGDPITYGLDHISVPDAWADYEAHGQGVRVAVLDTGVDAQHPDLADRLVTEDPSDPLYPGGWMHLDYEGNAQAKRPADPATHGTHVSGTVLGGDASGTQIGVAPDAQLMAVNAISDGSSSAKILKALEWSLDPYDTNGEPAGRPADVINMSLGSADANFENIYLFEAVQRVRDAGIFPAIASGNDMVEGSECISNPSSSYDAFAVGMTNEDKGVNNRSCGGTTNWSNEIVTQFDWPAGSFVKPDASAPGTDVYSAVPSGGWGNSTGTSMATPHVAGAVAVLRSAQPGLTVDELEAALEVTAWHPEKAENTEFSPDIRYGHGIIDVSEAITYVQDEAGFDVTIQDDAGEPLSGVIVSWADLDSDDDDRKNPEYGETWVSDDNGRVKSYLRPGRYKLHFERFGYENHSVDVQVQETGFVQVDATMQRMTTGTVTGTVTSETGDPIEDVSVSLVGSDIAAVTNAQGLYTLDDVPETSEGGKGHRLRASGENLYTVTSDYAMVVADATTTVDFTLSELPRIAVLGSATPRSAEFLSNQNLVVNEISDLPAELAELTEYDVIIWDDPGTVSSQALQQVIALTDKSGTGIIWLDLGATDTSGIAQLNSHFQNPSVRTAQNDVEDDASIGTGYRIKDGAGGHPLFEAGDVYTGALLDGSKIIQDDRKNTPKFWAAFERLSSDSAQELAVTYSTELTTSGNPHDIHRGTGIAVDERAGNRHAYLALHGAHTSVDANTWSTANKQVLVNAVNWVAQGEQADVTPPQPDIEEPEPPCDGDDPGQNSNGGNAQNKGKGNTAGQGSNPAAAAAQPQNATPGGSSSNNNSLSSNSGSRAPENQAVPKPEFTPDPPVDDVDELTDANAGGITVQLSDGIAQFTIPESQAGDWYFLHVYPSKTPVDWIRVNSEGQLQVDVSTLTDGSYKFAFTNPDSQLVGWTELRVGEGAPAEQDQAEVLSDSPTALPPVTNANGFALSTLELLMLAGAAVLLLSAAGLMFMSLRNKDTAEAAA